MCIMTGLGGVGKEGKEIVHPEIKNLSLFTNRSNQFSNFVCGTEKEIFFFRQNVPGNRYKGRCRKTSQNSVHLLNCYIFSLD